MSQDDRTTLIGQVYLFDKNIPEAESRRLAEYFIHHHADVLGPSVFNETALTQEIECIRGQIKNRLKKRFELPGQAPVFVDWGETTELKSDMDQAWDRLPYEEREDLKWTWM